MNDMHLQTDKTSLDSTKITFFRGIFAYFFHRKLFSASFLIGLCSICLLWSTGFRCSRKNRHALNVTKKNSKSNTSNHFSDLLPLRREVDPLSPPLLSSQSVKRLYVKDALTKQEPSGTKPTSIALAQLSLLENRLQKEPLPSKDTSTNLPIDSRLPKKKDNLWLVDVLPLQGNQTTPETGVVAKDDPKKITPTNNIQSKKPKLLAEPKPEGTYPSTAIAIESSNVCDRSNVNNNIKLGHVKNIKAYFENKEEESITQRLRSIRTPIRSNVNGTVLRSTETHDEDLDQNAEFDQNAESKKCFIRKINEIKKIINNIQEDQLTDIVNNIKYYISKYIHIISWNHNHLSQKIEECKSALKIEEDGNVKNDLIKLIEEMTKTENNFVPKIQEGFDSLSKSLLEANTWIDNEIQTIDEKLNDFQDQLGELNKLIKDLSECSYNYNYYSNKNLLNVATNCLDLIENFKAKIQNTLGIFKDKLISIKNTLNNNNIKDMITHLRSKESDEDITSSIEIEKIIDQVKHKKAELKEKFESFF